MKLYLITNLFHCVCKLKVYVLKDMTVRNGCFVQESLHEFLNQGHWSLNSLSLSYSQTFFGLAPSPLESSLISSLSFSRMAQYGQ